MTAAASAPAASTSPTLVSVIPPMATKGTGTSGRTRRSSVGADELEPRLGGGGVHAAHRHVVGPVGNRLAGLRGVVGGDAEDHRRRQDAARRRRREIVLADVQAVRLHRTGEIGPVVHDEERPCLPASRAEGMGQGQEVDHGARLVAELDEPRAAREHGLEQGGQGAPARRLPSRIT